MDERRQDSQLWNLITNMSYSHKGNFSCTGKFRYEGNFIIFYAQTEIEKGEGCFMPNVTTVHIPVRSTRRHDETRLIERTGITGVKKRTECVAGLADYLKGIFEFYQVSNNQYMGEILHAIGYDPVKYGYPPSAGDERSSYYGGNRAHLGPKGNGMRYDKTQSFQRSNNLFSYLDEVNRRDVVKVSVKQKWNEERRRPASDEIDEALDSVAENEGPVEEYNDAAPEDMGNVTESHVLAEENEAVASEACDEVYEDEDAIDDCEKTESEYPADEGEEEEGNGVEIQYEDEPAGEEEGQVEGDAEEPSEK
jgi:hypothetical protein